MFRYLLITWLALVASNQTLAKDELEYGPIYVQGLLGALDAGNAWTLTDSDTGETLESDLGRLIFGGVISWRPVKPFRLYLGAGPALAIGTLSVKDDTPVAEPVDGSSVSEQYI